MATFSFKSAEILAGIYILARGGGNFFPNWKKWEEFEGGLHEKRKGKRGKEKKRKVIKTHVEIPLWFLNNLYKTFREGGGIFLAGQNIYPWILVIFAITVQHCLYFFSAFMQPLNYYWIGRYDEFAKKPTCNLWESQAQFQFHMPPFWRGTRQQLVLKVKYICICI